MSVDLSGTVPGGEFKAGTPRRLFTGLRAIGLHNYDVSPDGRRFLVVTQGLETSSSPIVVVLNWKSGVVR